MSASELETKFCTLKDSIRSQRNVFETTKTGSIRIIQTARISFRNCESSRVSNQRTFIQLDLLREEKKTERKKN